MSDNNNNSTGGRSLGGNSNEPLPSSWVRPAEAPRVGRIGDWSGSSRGGGSTGGGRFGTIGSLNPDRPPPPGGSGHSSDDEDEDPDKRETWFTGGERSGLSVQNPDSAPRNVPGGDLVRSLLRRAAEGGPPPAAQSSRAGPFSGAGNTLGSDDVPSTFIPDPNDPAGDELPIVTRTITLWRDGFTIEDGELLRYDDPNNAELIAQLQEGRAPLSVLNIAPSQEVDLHISKRTNEDYVPPKGSNKAFSGSGNRLGAPVPNLTTQSQTPSSMPGSFPSTSSAAAPARESISTRFEVDQTLPTTSIQIRLADGTRMICRMNLIHTVLDIRNFINASRPENNTRPYTIGTTFPNRTLDDNTATIESAKLQNSVIVQRWV